MNEMRRIEGDLLVEAPTAATPAIDVPAPPKRRRLALMLAVPLLIAAVGLYFWLTSGKTVSTDNAQVTAHVVSIAPEVSGRITGVFVAENQRIKAGDLLYQVDPAPYRIALMEADAAVGNARLQIAQMESGYSARVADIGVKASDVQLAEENFRRQRDLLARGFTTRAAFDSARAALASAQSERNSAAADAQSARAMLGISAAGGHPQVEAAIAMRDKAALALKHTEIRAPIDGIASQTDRLNTGAMATQMLPNISIVGGGAPWVEANFKETQLAKIRVGQPAEIEIDAIPGRTFKAHVASIGAGTGSEFSLLPAQNATGNWVKVTQRVPVRLKFDEKPDRALVSGWSAHVTVHVVR
jgi:membrane fusion protein (multidrug efflux system)